MGSHKVDAWYFSPYALSTGDLHICEGCLEGVCQDRRFERHRVIYLYKYIYIFIHIFHTFHIYTYYLMIFITTNRRNARQDILQETKFTEVKGYLFGNLMVENNGHTLEIYAYFPNL